MDAFSGQCVQIGRQNGHQGFAFTGFHFRNPALMEHNAANQLHRIGAHAQNPVCRLPADCKGLWQECIQGLSILIPLLEFFGFCRQFPVCELLAVRAQSLDLRN